LNGVAEIRNGLVQIAISSVSVMRDYRGSQRSDGRIEISNRLSSSLIWK